MTCCVCRAAAPVDRAERLRNRCGICQSALCAKCGNNPEATFPICPSCFAAKRLDLEDMFIGTCAGCDWQGVSGHVGSWHGEVRCRECAPELARREKAAIDEARAAEVRKTVAKFQKRGLTCDRCRSPWRDPEAFKYMAYVCATCGKRVCLECKKIEEDQERRWIHCLECSGRGRPRPGMGWVLRWLRRRFSG